MCHGAASAYFPEPEIGGEFSAELDGLVFGDETASVRIALIPDIYGTNAFYQGFATHLAQKGARVFLTNPFAGLGDLPEVTREAAFARRNKLHDNAMVDRLEAFCGTHSITGVIGFCLGGSYVFELSRRGVSQDLVGFYGFPQGMENQDPMQKPFDYLADVSKAQTCLMPGSDQSVGLDNVARLAEIAADNDSLDLTVYPDSGHGFLADLDSEDATLKANAVDALKRCESALGLS